MIWCCLSLNFELFAGCYMLVNCSFYRIIAPSSNVDFPVAKAMVEPSHIRYCLTFLVSCPWMFFFFFILLWKSLRELHSGPAKSNTSTYIREFILLVPTAAEAILRTIAGPMQWIVDSSRSPLRPSCVYYNVALLLLKYLLRVRGEVFTSDLLFVLYVQFEMLTPWTMLDRCRRVSGYSFATCAISLCCGISVTHSFLNFVFTLNSLIVVLLVVVTSVASFDLWFVSCCQV